MATNENNNGLYFIVGALIVAVLVMGFFMLGNNDNADNNPVAVVERTIERTSDSVEKEADGFELNVDNNGFSGTVRDTE